MAYATPDHTTRSDVGVVTAGSDRLPRVSERPGGRLRSGDRPADAFWTPERRARASEIAKARWEATSPEVREERRRRGWETFRDRYPARAEAYEALYAAIDAGRLVPQPCELCGADGLPFLDRLTHELVGWRCRPCRKAPA